jgi:hypothetical protein
VLSGNIHESSCTLSAGVIPLKEYTDISNPKSPPSNTINCDRPSILNRKYWLQLAASADAITCTGFPGDSLTIDGSALKIINAQ